MPKNAAKNDDMMATRRGLADDCAFTFR